MSFTIQKANRPSVRVGAVYGRLTVIEDRGMKGVKRIWLCKCVCGNSKVTQADRLRHGQTRSCGCLQLETMQSRWKDMTKHGESRRSGRSQEWKVWIGMIQRCHDQNHPSYHRYGAKGIVVCKRWRDSYESFLADIGRMPSRAHTIERKKNELGYSPDNCRWATRTEQANNRSTNHHLTANGQTHTAAEWGRILGVHSLTLIARTRRGWADEKVINTPLRKQNVI